ncbi:carotenoid biosynthesis protein [filamentous cyanobacterium LEGE 11480]|uniref:Carotenoid biosynthesis protein n=1 Tax=Romeriopsis navalis LEGE 11480 TaxID=2777977 RepID=A0A928VM53_9CYAN|nr:carotenoid biosynthesis protein [Romeriopsis navalis]MBE9031153.1 carotenoid biosynthesis protein [Romeriopsis navalis LEGE 11480]
MQRILTAERGSLIGHAVSLLFGLAGLLLVLPNPEFIAALPSIGQQAFGFSMANGGVVYILLGAITMSLYAWQHLGQKRWLSFMLPAIGLSLSSELLGTSTGFPFGAYGYLSGLGYKIAGLVPFTIPLSWFYMGLGCYVLARAGCEQTKLPLWVQQTAAIGIGAILLTAWDFVLDPAMSQTPFPFWEFNEPGSFFGMPYRNITGWVGTGMLFMGVATLIWGKPPLRLRRAQLNTPLAIYLINFAFGAVITLTQLDTSFWVMMLLGISFGVMPALLLWKSVPVELNDLADYTPTMAESIGTP